MGLKQQKSAKIQNTHLVFLGISSKCFFLHVWMYTTIVSEVKALIPPMMINEIDNTCWYDSSKRKDISLLRISLTRYNCNILINTKFHDTYYIQNLLQKDVWQEALLNAQAICISNKCNLLRINYGHLPTLSKINYNRSAMDYRPVLWYQFFPMVARKKRFVL